MFAMVRGAPRDDSEVSRWYAEANELRVAWQESGAFVLGTYLKVPEHPGLESAVPLAQADHQISQLPVALIGQPESAPC